MLKWQRVWHWLGQLRYKSLHADVFLNRDAFPAFVKADFEDNDAVVEGGVVGFHAEGKGREAGWNAEPGLKSSGWNHIGSHD